MQIPRMCRVQSNSPIEARHFALPDSSQRLILTPAALMIFARYRQVRNQPEAGGLLFAEFDLPFIRIVEATSPHATDKRWRTLFMPNRTLQRKRIKQLFLAGRHFVGEWHTHPEPNPTPSSLDLESMSDAFAKSSHDLNYFLMIIVGNRSDRLQIWVSAHDKFRSFRVPELSCQPGRLDTYA